MNKYLRLTDLESIKQIDFSIYSNYQIKKFSVIEESAGITIAETYNNKNKIVNGGVIDRRLGITINRKVCETCRLSAVDCPGHFGHIKLAEAIFHINYVTYLEHILKCICIRCGKVRLPIKDRGDIVYAIRNLKGKKRNEVIRAITKKIKSCQGENYNCGTPAHKITFDKSNFIIIAEPDKKIESENNEKKLTQVLTAQMCYDILKLISDEDCMILGLDPKKTRPEDLLIVFFPVPPVQMRPSIKTDAVNTMSIDDDLTQKLIGIVKSNENLKNIKADVVITKMQNLDDLILLQTHAATYFNNQLPDLPKSYQKNNTETKGIVERISGKKGRIRGNLMSKRVDESARTVISPEIFLDIEEIGMPIYIAKILTYPEIVTENNIGHLYEIVKNGPNKYPGANSVIKFMINDRGEEVNALYDLKYRVQNILLKPGDIVERHLINGDWVIFNRQPTLHKLSMMGHKVVVFEDPKLTTFRLNVSVTDPYNAD